MAGLFAWTFTTLAVGAKNQVTSIPRFILIESVFTLAQFGLVGPLLALSARV